MARELRKIIRIDEKKCNGCGLCTTACHEGAIDIVDGKAKLVFRAARLEQFLLKSAKPKHMMKRP